jgi:hypothetical protein
MKTPRNKPVTAFAEVKHSPLDRTDVMERDTYHCPELRPFQGRPGSMDAYKLPSRIGNKFFFLKGHTK